MADPKQPALVLTIYSQDGDLVSMPVADTQTNRQIVAWLKVHDRYTVHNQEDRRDDR